MRKEYEVQTASGIRVLVGALFPPGKTSRAQKYCLLLRNKTQRRIIQARRQRQQHKLEDLLKPLLLLFLEAADFACVEL